MLGLLSGTFVGSVGETFRAQFTSFQSRLQTASWTDIYGPTACMTTYQKQEWQRQRKRRRKQGRKRTPPGVVPLRPEHVAMYTGPHTAPPDASSFDGTWGQRYEPELVAWAVGIVRSRAFTVSKRSDPGHPLHNRAFIAPGYAKLTGISPFVCTIRCTQVRSAPRLHVPMSPMSPCITLWRYAPSP